MDIFTHYYYMVFYSKTIKLKYRMVIIISKNVNIELLFDNIICDRLLSENPYINVTTRPSFWNWIIDRASITFHKHHPYPQRIKENAQMLN